MRLDRLAKLAFDQIRQASVTTPAILIRQLEAICGSHRDFRTPAVKRCRIKRTRSRKRRVRWSRLIAATSTRRGNLHTPRSRSAAPAFVTMAPRFGLAIPALASRSELAEFLGRCHGCQREQRRACFKAGTLATLQTRCAAPREPSQAVSVW